METPVLVAGGHRALSPSTLHPKDLMVKSELTEVQAQLGLLKDAGSSPQELAGLGALSQAGVQEVTVQPRLWDHTSDTCLI